MKKILFASLIIIVIGVFIRYQKFFVHTKSSQYCYLETRTDYIPSLDGNTYAYQNDYIVIKSKGVRNYIFPYSHVVYVPNPEGKNTCDDLKNYSFDIMRSIRLR